jgi:hypothetical protein
MGSIQQEIAAKFNGIDSTPKGKRQNFKIDRSDQGQLPIGISASHGMITMESAAWLGHHRARRLNGAPSGRAQPDPGQLQTTRFSAASHVRRARPNGRGYKSLKRAARSRQS